MHILKSYNLYSFLLYWDFKVEVDSEVLLRIERFKNDLRIMNAHSLYNKYITWSDCYIMSDDVHNYLREQIAGHFQIDPSYVVVVGSAKLGFSIARGKRYRQFIKVTDISNDHPSDIDVAIISPDLFDAAWKEVFDYWSDGGSIDYLTWTNRDRNDFRKYLFRGWLRPDKLPTSSTLNLYKDWWEFFEQLPSLGSFGSSKIAGGIYKSWHFLEKYQSVCINECKQELEFEEEAKPSKI